MRNMRESGEVKQVLLSPTCSSVGALAVGQSWCEEAYPPVARGPLTAVRHQDEAFRPNVGPGFLLLDDSGQAQVAGVHQQFLEDTGRMLLTGLPSPDTNPINYPQTG